MNSLSSPENIFYWPAVYGTQHTTFEILTFRPAHFAYGSSYFLVLGETIKYNVRVREWGMAEAVCSKSFTGGRRISWVKKSVCLGSGQIAISKKSSSETTQMLGGSGFSYTFGILHVAGIFFCVQFTLGSASQSTSRLYYDDWWMTKFKEYRRQRS